MDRFMSTSGAATAQPAALYDLLPCAQRNDRTDPRRSSSPTPPTPPNAATRRCERTSWRARLRPRRRLGSATPRPASRRWCATSALATGPSSPAAAPDPPPPRPSRPPPTRCCGSPHRDHPPRTRRSTWPPQPLRLASDDAGVLLLVPGLVALDLPGAVSAARLPGTREVPALHSALSLLALKAIGRRRVCHVDDVATDPALATFAGLESLPKATALGTYSWRLQRRHQQALLAALGPAMLRTGQAAGTDFDLDFHAIMHYGHDVALETHYVPRRSQRTQSVLTFFAQDGQTHNLVYAGATCTKTSRAGEVMAFARHWQQATGKLPELLVFDSKVTTGAGLFELDQAGIGFLTLRARSPKLMQTLDALPTSAWTRITLDRTGPYRHPQVHEDHVKVRGCPVWLRQRAVRGLGHDQPTLILTNNHTAKPAKLIDRYAKRMIIEQRLGGR